MACASRDHQREELVREVASVGYRDLLERLHATGRLCGFETWPDVISFMHTTEGEQHATKDEILRCVLRDHQECRDPRWQTILLVMFWPGLETILWQNRKRNPDIHSRWQDVVCSFVQAVCRVNVDKRQDRFAAKLFNDTVHLLRDQYRRRERQAEREQAVPPSKAAGLVGARRCERLETVDLEDEVSALAQRLRGLVGAGHLKEDDLRLVMETRVGGKSLSDVARRTGLDYQTIKKRRQRAEAIIRQLGGSRKG